MSGIMTIHARGVRPAPPVRPVTPARPTPPAVATPPVRPGPVDAPAGCPRCAHRLHRPAGRPPWCPACEWNLDAYDPDRPDRDFTARWPDRLAFRFAYRSGNRLFAALAAAPLGRRTPGPARVAALAAALALHAGVAALAVVGALLVARDFPTPLLVPGLLALAAAWTLRPRLGRLDPLATPLDRAAAPRLHALVDRVAAAVGAPRPDVIILDDALNASAGTVGLRGRRVLTLGLPLWSALDPQERVALLGHELAHFVNGDVRRTRLTGSACATLAEVADLLAPAPHVGGDGTTVGLLVLVADRVSRLLLRLAGRLVGLAHAVLCWLTLRDSQRAEYRADELAAAAAGTAATRRLLDKLIAAESLETVLCRSARAGGGPAQWRAEADAVLAGRRGRLAALRRESVRTDARLFASHPQPGLRAAMLDARPPQPLSVRLSPAEDARIDAELSPAAEPVRLSLAHS
ncbi:M48 family metallopeptidase [Pilimelia anulata]|nr:M48 family metallopeptidase [Pilimelia anulata]